MKNKIENDKNNKQFNIRTIVISFFKFLIKFLGVIIGVISLPFLLFGIIGWSLICSLKYFGINMNEDDDVYLSGPLRGLPKN